MNKQIWGGIISWGIVVTCFGLASQNAARTVTNTLTGAALGEEMIILLAGGAVTTLIGIVGLAGSMHRSARITSLELFRPDRARRGRDDLSAEQG